MHTYIAYIENRRNVIVLMKVDVVNIWYIVEMANVMMHVLVGIWWIFRKSVFGVMGIWVGGLGLRLFGGRMG